MQLRQHLVTCKPSRSGLCIAKLLFFLYPRMCGMQDCRHKFIDTPKPLTHYKVVASETPIAAITCAGLKQWSHHISQPATAIV